MIPAAGLGTRMLPYTKVAPKEMMPLVDTPVIQHVVSEAVASGIETIIFVINESRAAVRNYFSPAPDLVDRLVLRGRVDEADSIRRLSRLADMRFVRQPEALGVGHAIACATEEIGDEPFAVLLPDNIVDFEVPCIKQADGVLPVVSGMRCGGARNRSEIDVQLRNAVDRAGRGHKG